MQILKLLCLGVVLPMVLGFWCGMLILRPREWREK